MAAFLVKPHLFAMIQQSFFLSNHLPNKKPETRTNFYAGLILKTALLILLSFLKKFNEELYIMKNLPSKNRKEWRDILSGEINIDFESFALQMKINQLKRFIEFDMKTEDECVDELYNLCKKYHTATKNDLNKIFK